MKRLGQEPAFSTPAASYHTAGGGAYHDRQKGMSQRLLIAKDMMPTASEYFNECSVKFIAEYIGIIESEYTYDHYKKAVVKYAIELADELLKQEAE